MKKYLYHNPILIESLRHGQTEQHCRATWPKRKCCPNVAQFGHCVGEQIHQKICCRNVSACSNIFWLHLSFSSMFPSLAIMLGNNSTQFSKWQKWTCAVLKCAQCNVNKMAAAPRVDLDGVDVARSVEVSPSITLCSLIDNRTVTVLFIIYGPLSSSPCIPRLPGPLDSRVSMPWFCSPFSNFHLHLRIPVTAR